MYARHCSNHFIHTNTLQLITPIFDDLRDGWKYKSSNWFLLILIGLQRKLKVMYVIMLQNALKF